MLTRRTLLAGIGALALPATPPEPAPRLARITFLDPAIEPARSFLARHEREWSPADWERAMPALEEAERAYQASAPAPEFSVDVPPGPLAAWLRADVAAFSGDEAGFVRALEIVAPYDEPFLAWRAGWYENSRMRLRLADVADAEADLALHGRTHPACARAAAPFARASARHFWLAASGGIAEAWRPFIQTTAILHSAGLA